MSHHDCLEKKFCCDCCEKKKKGKKFCPAYGQFYWQDPQAKSYSSQDLIEFNKTGANLNVELENDQKTIKVKKCGLYRIYWKLTILQQKIGCECHPDGKISAKIGLVKNNEFSGQSFAIQLLTPLVREPIFSEEENYLQVNGFHACCLCKGDTLSLQVLGPLEPTFNIEVISQGGDQGCVGAAIEVEKVD